MLKKLSTSLIKEATPAEDATAAVVPETVVIKMLREMNRDRYKALQLLADHLRTPSKELSLNAIFNDVKDEDLKWVTEKIHYYLLRLLEDADYEIEDEVELVSLMD